MKRATRDLLPVVSGEIVLDLVDQGREDSLRNFLNGPPFPLKHLYTGEIKGD